MIWPDGGHEPTRLTKLLVAAATAAGVSLLLYFPDRDDGSGAILGGLATLIGVSFAQAPLAKHRPLPRRSSMEHSRLTLQTLGIGAGLGIANLLVNYGMAVSKPAIYEQMVSRWARFSPGSIVISGPIIEEIAYRLVLLSGLAWIAARFTDNRRTITLVALGVSSSVFGVAHIFYGGVDDPIYVMGMAVKSRAGGLLLGWVFWRRGLPYSIACHAAANATHLLLMPVLFDL
jgi:membrane protease YdiL (CAAX protease family)